MLEFVVGFVLRFGNGGCVCDLIFLFFFFIDYLININGFYCFIEIFLKGMIRKI